MEVRGGREFESELNHGNDFNLETADATITLWANGNVKAQNPALLDAELASCGCRSRQGEGR